MKVLMLTGAYYPEISSGGLQVQQMARVLQPQVEVRVLTTALDRTTPRHSSVDGVEVTRVHLRDVSVASKAAAAMTMVSELARLVRWSDVVHIHGVSSKNTAAAAIAKLRRKPVVLSLHTMGQDAPKPIRARGRLTWWAFRQAARFMSVSPALREAYLAAGLPANRIDLVGNGIALDRFVPPSPGEKQELRRSLGLPRDRPHILFVGFFSHDKQPRVLFDAWNKLRDAHGIDAQLVFVGATKSGYQEVDGSIVDRMRADAEALGRSRDVVFTGPVHDPERYFRLADVYVLPSRREGLPVALLEAMACGLPCVASRLPGATDTLIDDGVSGLLVPPGNVDAFADGMRAMLTDPNRSAAMGGAARRTIEMRFSAEAIAARWLENYRLALAQASIGPEKPGPPAAG